MRASCLALTSELEEHRFAFPLQANVETMGRDVRHAAFGLGYQRVTALARHTGEQRVAFELRIPGEVDAREGETRHTPRADDHVDVRRLPFARRAGDGTRLDGLEEKFAGFVRAGAAKTPDARGRPRPRPRVIT